MRFNRAGVPAPDMSPEGLFKRDDPTALVHVHVRKSWLSSRNPPCRDGDGAHVNEGAVAATALRVRKHFGTLPLMLSSQGCLKEFCLVRLGPTEMPENTMTSAADEWRYIMCPESAAPAYMSTTEGQTSLRTRVDVGSFFACAACTDLDASSEIALKNSCGICHRNGHERHLDKFTKTLTKPEIAGLALYTGPMVPNQPLPASRPLQAPSLFVCSTRSTMPSCATNV